MKRKIVVIGLGAVGTVLVASLLENPENQIIVIVKQKHLKCCKKQKVIIDGVINKELTFDIRTKIDFSLENTLVIPVVKIYDLKSIFEELQNQLFPTTSFLILTNGMNVRQEIVKWSKGSISKNNLYRGIVSFGATLKSIGDISFFGGSLVLEDEVIKMKLFKDSLDGFLKIKSTPDLKKALWKKLVINCIYNPISLIYKIKNKTVSLPELDQLKRQILDECVRIAALDGIKINLDLAKLNSIVTSDNYTSMLQDFLYDRQTEIEYLNGEVIKIAEKYGASAPLNSFIVTLIKIFEYTRDNNLAIIQKKIK